MIEVFTTNIPDTTQAACVIKMLENKFSGLKISFDIERPITHYPCDHSILRLEGETIEIAKVILAVQAQGFRCDILEDKLCTP